MKRVTFLGFYFLFHFNLSFAQQIEIVDPWACWCTGIYTPQGTVNGATSYNNNHLTVPCQISWDPVSLDWEVIRLSTSATVAHITAPITNGGLDCQTITGTTGFPPTCQTSAQCEQFSVPIRLFSFNLLYINGKVYLNWESVDENNFSHYTIEKRTDSSDWISLGEVVSKGVTGFERNEYEFIDYNSRSETSYYRLKMTDLDGSFAYSKELFIRDSDSEVVLSISPNPGSEIINLSGEYENIVVHNAVGQLILNKTLESNSIDVSKWINGFYYFNFQLDSGKSHVIQFIKR